MLVYYSLSDLGWIGNRESQKQHFLPRSDRINAVQHLVWYTAAISNVNRVRTAMCLSFLVHINWSRTFVHWLQITNTCSSVHENNFSATQTWSLLRFRSLITYSCCLHGLYLVSALFERIPSPSDKETGATNYRKATIHLRWYQIGLSPVLAKKLIDQWKYDKIKCLQALWPRWI